MKKILLYTPKLQGHPQIYCRVIADGLVDHAACIFIASGNSLVNIATQFPVLSIFLNRQKIQFIDTRQFSTIGKAALSAEELLKLQEQYEIDSTLIVEGDYFRDQFYRIHLGNVPKLRMKNTVIMNNTAGWYPGESKFSGEPESLFASTLRGNLGKIKRFVFKHKESNQYFFEKILCNSSVVDSVIIKDERIVDKFGGRYQLMPEIYKVFRIQEHDINHEDWEIFAGPVKDYVRIAGKENVVLFFGTGAWYKGYDLYLKFLEKEKGAFGIHAGRSVVFDKNKPFAWDVEKLRSSLISEGRLLETRRFIESSKLIDLLFSSTERFVSTHRMTQSSGTMLQALDYGKPVLVPTAGCVGARAINNKLGETYKYLDPDDLCEKWLSFKQKPACQYQNDIKSFMQNYSKEKVEDFFVQALLD